LTYVGQPSFKLVESKHLNLKKKHLNLIKSLDSYKYLLDFLILLCLKFLINILIVWTLETENIMIYTKIISVHF